MQKIAFLIESAFLEKQMKITKCIHTILLWYKFETNCKNLDLPDNVVKRYSVEGKKYTAFLKNILQNRYFLYKIHMLNLLKFLQKAKQSPNFASNRSAFCAIRTKSRTFPLYPHESRCLYISSSDI